MSPSGDFPGARAAACRSALRSRAAGDRGGVVSARGLVASHLALPCIAAAGPCPSGGPQHHSCSSCTLSLAVSSLQRCTVQVRQLLRLQRFLLSSYNSRASAELAVRMPNCLSTEGSCRQLKARGGTGRTAPEISLPLGLRTVRGSSMLNMPGFPEAEHGWNLKQKVFSDAAQYSIGNEDVVQGAEVSCHGQASAILLQVWFF